ncbi:MAG: hypothetical protein D6820_07680, partial [Lentisphaerae bacterium]
MDNLSLINILTGCVALLFGLVAGAAFAWWLAIRHFERRREEWRSEDRKRIEDEMRSQQEELRLQLEKE